MDVHRRLAIVFNSARAVSRTRIQRAQHRITSLIFRARADDPPQKIFRFWALQKKCRLRRAFKCRERLRTRLQCGAESLGSRLEFSLPAIGQAQEYVSAAVSRCGSQVSRRGLLGLLVTVRRK